MVCKGNKLKYILNNFSIIPLLESVNFSNKLPFPNLQSYDSKFLQLYPELPPTPLQLEEDLEQLKVLENGYKMKVCHTWSCY